jgi:integrase
MASVHRRSTSRGNRYDVRFRLADGSPRKRTFRTRKEADQYAATVEVDRLRGTLLDPTRGRITFAEWCDQYLEVAARTKRPTTYARDLSVLRTHFRPALGRLPLSAISPRHLRDVVDTMSVSLAPRTVRTNYGVASGVFTAAVDADLIARTPCRGIKLPAVERKPERFLTPAELDALVSGVPIEHQAMIRVAATLGLRWSEVIALRCRHVSLSRRTVAITETISEVDGLLLSADVKTKASRRTLPLTARTAEALAEHMARRGLTSSVEDALLFVAPDGGPLRHSNFRTRVWQPAVKAARLGRLTFHDLRHSAVGFLIEAGAHPSVIQKRLGHASIRTTLDVYGHVLPTTDQEVTERLELLLGPQQSAPFVTSPRPVGAG